MAAAAARCILPLIAMTDCPEEFMKGVEESITAVRVSRLDEPKRMLSLNPVRSAEVVDRDGKTLQWRRLADNKFRPVSAGVGDVGQMKPLDQVRAGGLAKE